MNLNNKAEFDQLNRNRRNFYGLLSRLYQAELSQEFYDKLPTIGFTLAKQDHSMPEFHQALARLNEYFEYDAGETLDDLAVDYAKTFLGAGIAQGEAAFPYESVYTSPKRILMQDAWVNVCEIYQAKGIECSKESSDLLEDHIAVELNFLVYLCDQTSQCTHALAGLEEQKDFLNRHLLKWVPSFCLEIRERADTEFYRMVGQLTSAFLQMDSIILDQMIAACKERTVDGQGFQVSKGKMNEILQQLSSQYHIYAPSLVTDRDTWGEQGLVRYQEIASVDEIVLDRQSDFSLKEVIFPVCQTLFQFDENSCTETKSDDSKGLIVFARACDVNGLKRLDNMFLSNGGFSDVYYKTLREKVRIFLIECTSSFDTCFCVSMGTNQTQDYSVACKLGGDTISLQVKDREFMDVFAGETAQEYTPGFVTENAVKVTIPNITSQAEVTAIHGMDFWAEVSENCISCGGCNMVCPTCSCFDTVDYLNQENSRKGERRRIWSSCMLPDYSKTAGGAIARPKAEQMMRFKALHKVYDYKTRFGGDETMCVGCGRCVHRCPKEICFSDTINRLSDAVDGLKKECE